MIEKKFGNGMRDILGSCHSLLRQSRAMFTRDVALPKKAAVQPFILFAFSHALNRWLKIAKTLTKKKSYQKQPDFFTHC